MGDAWEGEHKVGHGRIADGLRGLAHDEVGRYWLSKKAVGVSLGMRLSMASPVAKRGAQMVALTGAEDDVFGGVILTIYHHGVGIFQRTVTVNASTAALFHRSLCE